jgi:hypothetical protein
MKLDKFEKNLSIINGKIYSFNTLVGSIKLDHIEIFDHNNSKITRHLKYCSEYFNKPLKKLVKILKE